jgi:hypothetical protein
MPYIISLSQLACTECYPLFLPHVHSHKCIGVKPLAYSVDGTKLTPRRLKLIGKCGATSPFITAKAMYRALPNQARPFPVQLAAQFSSDGGTSL